MVVVHGRAYFAPGHALVLELAYALSSVCDQADWHDVNHRRNIARHIAAAADAIDHFMLRDFETVSGLKGAPAVRRRLSTAAAALRQKLVWLATPGPETRGNLESELRVAVIAAATGQLDQLGGADALDDAGHSPRRSWWVQMVALSRGVAWAFAPLVLVKLGGLLRLPFLETVAEQEAAQKAAYVWLALSALRALSPSSFKETMDTAGSLFDRIRAGR